MENGHRCSACGASETGTDSGKLVRAYALIYLFTVVGVALAFGAGMTALSLQSGDSYLYAAILGLFAAAGGAVGASKLHNKIAGYDVSKELEGVIDGMTQEGSQEEESARDSSQQALEPSKQKPDPKQASASREQLNS